MCPRGDDELLVWSIPRPLELNREAWKAISDAADRLTGAIQRDDIPAVIGSAKEMCETIARVILAQRGPSVGSNVSYGDLITMAHRAIERQPGEGVAADEDVRKIAQCAKTIVVSLGPLRNQRGTGHGRAEPPDVEVEHACIAGDAAFLWGRWALRRLGHYMLGDVSVLVNKLTDDTFRRGVLAERLRAVDLPRRTADEARLLGVSVGQRAVRETFLVQAEGVEAAIAAPDRWTPTYRGGVIEGLLFSADGTVTSSPWAVDSAARLLALQPDAVAVIERLENLAVTAAWTAPAVGSPPSLDEVTEAIRRAAQRLPADLRIPWSHIADSIERTQAGLG